eukprot:SAG31_NODE_1992_length_6709_cov_3.654870_6_plen_75_part_00
MPEFSPEWILIESLTPTVFAMHLSVQIWLSKEKLSEVVASGFQGILSNSDLWYLDNEHGTWQASWRVFFANVSA